MRRIHRLSRAIALAFLAVLVLGLAHTAWADSPTDVTAALQHGDVYLTPNAISKGVATKGDVARLQHAVDTAARAGVDEKIAIISSFPSKYSSAQAATVALRKKLGFGGILVAVTPQAIGISNSLLTRRDIERIDRTATNDKRCDANKPVGCALLAAAAAVPAYKDERAIVNLGKGLAGRNVIITPGAMARHMAVPSDVTRLDAAARRASAKNVTEKFLILSKYPEGYSNPTAAAGALQKRINLSGVLVMVAPDGLGIGSDLLSSGDRNKIMAQVGTCTPSNATQCAVAAGKAAIPLYQNQQAYQQMIGRIILGIVGFIILAIGALFVRSRMRKRKQTRERLEDLRTAATNTLERSDDDVRAIEAKTPLPAAASKAYDAALALRSRATEELDKAHTDAQLVEANQDAAQSALAFQGVMKTLGLPLAPESLLAASSAHRCFYCAHTDRPPYSTKTITDGKGNSMDVDVCVVDAKTLEEGRTPKVATVQTGRRSIPWWAVAQDPYYYRYGGLGWQYWLPYATGVNVNGWYDGGWKGSYSEPKPDPSKGADWGGSGGDRDTSDDIAAGHMSGTSSWGGGGKSGGDW